MTIKVGGFAQSKMDGAEEPDMNEILGEPETVVDKYTGEEFEIERNNDFITILPRIITPEGCDHIIEQFLNLPFTECDYADSEVTPPDEITDRNLSYKYEADHNKDHATIAQDSKEYNAVLEVMGHLIPNHTDFATITYMQIVHYHVSIQACQSAFERRSGQRGASQAEHTALYLPNMLPLLHGQ